MEATDDAEVEGVAVEMGSLPVVDGVKVFFDGFADCVDHVFVFNCWREATVRRRERKREGREEVKEGSALTP